MFSDTELTAISDVLLKSFNKTASLNNIRRNIFAFRHQVWFWFDKEGSRLSENFFYTPWPKESTDCETAGKSHGLQQLRSMGVSNKTMSLQDNANPDFFLCSLKKTQL